MASPSVGSPIETLLWIQGYPHGTKKKNSLSYCHAVDISIIDFLTFLVSTLTYVDEPKCAPAKVRPVRIPARLFVAFAVALTDETGATLRFGKIIKNSR